ncbi:hypothetical protein AAVH_02450 [Aphelenchoides avenae]|nr:hypothetical protein AAVH_02450 [Aphelenchus avenae]
MLTSATLGAVNHAKRQKKDSETLSRPPLPNDSLLEIVLFADRDTLDAMQLVGRFLFKFIQDHEAKKLSLRSISRVRIGKFFWSWTKDRSKDYWLPIVKVVRDSNADMELRPDTVSQLVPYLRLAYCESLYVDLRWARPVLREHRQAGYGAFFGDLLVPTTVFNELKVCIEHDGTLLALRTIETFKPQSKVVVKACGYHDWRSIFDEAFFLSMVERGVRSIEFKSDAEDIPSIDLASALSFGFAGPAAGGCRSISGASVSVYSYDHWVDPHFADYEPDRENFLEELIEMARALDGRQHIDFRFSIDALSDPINAVGFEKYQKDMRSWFVSDLENGVMLEVVEVEQPLFPTVEIHVFSLA